MNKVVDLANNIILPQVDNSIKHPSKFNYTSRSRFRQFSMADINIDKIGVVKDAVVGTDSSTKKKVNVFRESENKSKISS